MDIEIDRRQMPVKPAMTNTGPDGMQARVQYYAPEVAGDVFLIVVCTDVAGIPDETFAIFSFKVDLQELPASESYRLTGFDPNSPDLVKRRHAQNHFGTPAMLAKIRELAECYQKKFPQSTIGVNDISLVQGGIFDLNGQWIVAAGHAAHRFGEDVDIDFPDEPAQQLELMRCATREVRLQPINEYGDHYHFRLRNATRTMAED